MLLPKCDKPILSTHSITTDSGSTWNTSSVAFCCDGKLYVNCDETKGWKCLLNEDDVPDATTICQSDTNCEFPLTFYDYDNTTFLTGCYNDEATLTYNPACNTIESKCSNCALELKRSYTTSDACVSLAGPWLRIASRYNCNGLDVCPNCESRATLHMQADTGFGNVSCIDFRLRTSCLYNSIPFCATLNDVLSSTQDNHARFNLNGASTCGSGSISTTSNCGHQASITSLSNYHTIAGACVCNTMYAYSCVGGTVENDFITVRGSFTSCLKQCGTDGKMYVCCDSTKGWKCLLNEDDASSGGTYISWTNPTTSCVNSITTENGITGQSYGPINIAKVGTGCFYVDDNCIIVYKHNIGSLQIRSNGACLDSIGGTLWLDQSGNVTLSAKTGSPGGNLYAASFNGQLNGQMSYGDPTVCGFRANQLVGDCYGLTPGDWGNYLNFAHGDYMDYYGASVRVPFWDAQRFTWRVNNNGSLCPIHELLDNRGGQTINCHNYYYTGEHAANTRSPAILSSSNTTGAGYNGGAWIGHNNQNYDGYWGLAEFGYYNAENGTLCSGLCVGRAGDVHADSFYSSNFNAACFQGGYGKLDFVTNNRVELSSAAGSGGTVIYGDGCNGYVYVKSSGLYLNGGAGSIVNQNAALFEQGFGMTVANVGTVLSSTTSNGGNDVDVCARCNLSISTHNNGDLNMYSDYDLCATARCSICLDAPNVIVCGNLTIKDNNVDTTYKGMLNRTNAGVLGSMVPQNTVIPVVSTGGVDIGGIIVSDVVGTIVMSENGHALFNFAAINSSNCAILGTYSYRASLINGTWVWDTERGIIQ